MAHPRQKLAIVISHPIQYHAPLYRRITEAGQFELQVFFRNDRGARPYFDKGAQVSVSYDNDILQGYSYKLLTRGDPSTIGEVLDQRTLPNLVNEIRAANPTAVYFHGYNHAAHIRAMLGLGKHGIKVFLRGENEDVLPRVWWKNLARESLLKLLLKKIDAVLYIGEKNREFFLRRHFPLNRMFFVPYAADNEYFGINCSAEDRQRARLDVSAEFGVNPEGVIFIVISKHRIEKRPLDIVDAFIKAHQMAPPIRAANLLLVGDGPLRMEMQRRVASAGLSNVTFAGFVKQSKLKKCLLAADYCINAAEEPWGCVYNEALPAGLGIISSDRVIGWHDLIKIGSNGFVYRSGCTDSLAHILRQCVEHREWIAPFREVSRSIARVYSYETCVDGLTQALQACYLQAF